ncbi:pyridoxal phosphate-dependent aminotransferase (plasmid) [Shinella sp. PSBB067]|uniref:pyridoxal phosphate-dependent aminotransferase n=1 Tax=Shinella sp. PSBB067 TaxID=2715959 RepID=UPI00193B54EC|nr:pyridoxal phosphate-dependent aminotransferase [Shinella sp. PSBB067]QRI66213.1 pyridoxal phosphate-dependent aminotransferase [Shinella sp. PSBB067]
MTSPSLSISPQAAAAPASGIAAVMKHGFGRSDIVPLWVGEGDLPTPALICRAAAAALERGETFYVPQPGIPELRQALARYHDRVYGGLFGKPFEPGRFFVTGSGMQAIQLAVRIVAGVGEEILVPTPAWPNFPASVGVAGAHAREVAMRFDPAGWTLDLDLLEASISPRTRAIFLNSPSNPTGWTADPLLLQAMLDLSRKHDLWIIADEVYGRFTYSKALAAPSLHSLVTEDDRVLFVNTFSKNWAMTGWRIGWIEAPAGLGPTIENLIQYSTSGVAAFMQRAACAALDDGEAFLAAQTERCRRGLECVASALSTSSRIEFAPAGAFYLFFRIDGITDSTAFAERLLRETGVGLAPGRAFGMAGEGYFRLCFARDAQALSTAAERLLALLDHDA